MPKVNSFPFFIARRYLFSRKSTHVIQIISAISVLGVMVGSAALIVLLSAFNGLESWVIGLYDAFDSDIKITHTDDKFFRLSDDQIKRIAALEETALLMPAIEENALATYGDASFICAVKGVGPAFVRMSGIDSMITDGSFSLGNDSFPQALVGAGVAYSLSLNLRNAFTGIDLYVPRPGAGYTLNPTEAFQSAVIRPSGIFQIQPEVDTRYIIVPYGFASRLFSREGMFSALEVKLRNSFNGKIFQEQAQAVLGPKFKIQNRFQQHELLYKIINSEKWAVYLILTFILVIAVFNIIGSMTMLIVDKRYDIRTLESLGADQPTLQRIFFLEGMLISVIGLLLGCIAGFVLIYLQDRVGLVMISELEAYPVQFRWPDLILIGLTVLGIGAMAAWFPATRLLKRYKLGFRES